MQQAQHEVVPSGRKGGMMKMAVTALVIVAAIVVVYFIVSSLSQSSKGIVDSSKYQAVFLTNGQVYFGKASNENSSYVSLAEVHYLILKKPLQNQQKEGEESQPEQAKPEYSLIKLGSEMHGPSSMSINRDQILFIENLKDDSKVVATIKNSAK